ncbi:hypothetical protein IZU99_09340 [Oscillospiraceae bacterium CM]|nr:hypothetical protein IZU99_09340 [Oscillospiraceae bacterium CM]
MFGKGKVKKRANEIVDNVLNDTNDLIETLKAKGYSISISKHETECLLLGMQSFLISGFKQDYDLALELVPAYQKKIMPFLNREEYSALTKYLNDKYLEYREIAIKIQFCSEQWQRIMFEEFAKQTITYMGTANTYETVETVVSFITLLYNNML